MPSATVRPPEGLTRDMRLASRLLINVSGTPLETFIACRRLPGKGWTSWESIAYQLRDALGEEFTREAVRRWAMRYGIPVDTTADDGRELVAAYRDAVTGRGIKFTP